MSENETIADIVNEICTSGFQIFNEIAVVVKIDTIKGWADRLDAAAKREREIARDLGRIDEKSDQMERAANTISRSLNPGNASALREATENIERVARFCAEMPRHTPGYPTDAERADVLYSRIKELGRVARAALSAPARNCDRFQTAKDALDAFIREKKIKKEDVDNMNLRDFFDWLFVPASPQDKPKFCPS